MKRTWVVFLVGVSSGQFLFPPPQQQYGGGGGGQLPLPLQSCQAEVQYFCPSPMVYQPPKMMACLKMHLADLSKECQQAFLTASSQFLPPDPVTGANCQTDAQILCSGIQEMPLIMKCLNEHMKNNGSMLSKGCKQNLLNFRPLDRADLIPEKFIESEAKHLTRFITGLAIAWLAIPLVLSFWALIMSIGFYQDWSISNSTLLRKRFSRKKMKRPRSDPSLKERENEDIQTVAIVEESQPSSQQRRSVQSGTDYVSEMSHTVGSGVGMERIKDSLTPPPCSLAFSSLNFWVPLSPDLRKPFQKRPEKKIISDASGFFEPGSLTAVMGPSGSGKSTLLRLIGGRSHNGRYSGMRYLNGISYGTGDYENIVRRQGFVYQSDSHFEKLTVWETLAFQAALRLPREMTLSQKLERVQQVMEELGIDSAASAQVGGHSTQGISGGQQRRLSIAVQLLCLPSVLFLDEPTSGLDATTSLKLVKTLHQLTQTRKTTIIMTIHQPRHEIFELFDQILLMGVGGNLGFCGPTLEAVEFISALPTVNLNSSTYDNPSDFILDAMGISAEAKELEGPAQNVIRDEVEFSRTMSQNFRETPQYEHLQKRMNDNSSNLPIIEGSFKSPGFFKQSWVLFARKMRRLTVDPVPILSSYLQVLGVSVVVSFAFSYQTSNPLEDPYKVTMLLILIISYAMMLPYLTLSIEHMDERSSVKVEALTGVASYSAYVFSTVLVETPRAVVQSCLVIGMVYSFHDLNTDLTNVTFCVVGLMVGVTAMQAVIAFFGAVTDRIERTYTLGFLYLGGGALFGGIMVKLDKIPLVFRWVYYISVLAVTQRALVVNDLLCCYLTTTCEDISAQIMRPPGAPPGSGPGDPGPSICPPDLQITGDGTEKGNLGRLALRVLGLHSVDNYKELLTLFCAAIICRLMTYTALRFRAWYEDRLMNNEEKKVGCCNKISSKRRNQGYQMVRDLDLEVSENEEIKGSKSGIEMQEFDHSSSEMVHNNV